MAKKKRRSPRGLPAKKAPAAKKKKAAATKRSSAARPAKKSSARTAARAKPAAKKSRSSAKRAPAPAKKAPARAKTKALAKAKTPAKTKAPTKAKAPAKREGPREGQGPREASPPFAVATARDTSTRKYAHELLEKSGAADSDPGQSFVDQPRSKDDLVEELGEEFVAEATSAEHAGEDILDQEVPEDRGGPFVETTAKEEFGYGTDLSNPKGAKREPFPTT